MPRVASGDAVSRTYADLIRTTPPKPVLTAKAAVAKAPAEQTKPQLPASKPDLSALFRSGRETRPSLARPGSASVPAPADQDEGGRRDADVAEAFGDGAVGVERDLEGQPRLLANCATWLGWS